MKEDRRERWGDDGERLRKDLESLRSVEEEKKKFLGERWKE